MGNTKGVGNVCAMEAYRVESCGAVRQILCIVHNGTVEEPLAGTSLLQYGAIWSRSYSFGASGAGSKLDYTSNYSFGEKEFTQ